MSATIDTATIVLGMHRSGTSALTRVLSLHGFDLPRTLIPASDVNERGFWESPQVNALNNEILESLGQNWFSFTPISRDWVQSAAATPFVDRARAMLAAEFGSADHLLLKDPRICRLANFWQLVLQPVATRLVTPIILRNPVEVARSLAKRNGFDEALGKLLWLRYCLDAEAETRGLTRTFVNYQDLLDDWRSVVRRLDADLALSLDQSASTEREVDAFLSTDLQHHRADDAKALVDISGIAQLHVAYGIMHRWGTGTAPVPDDFKSLDDIRAALDASAPLFVSLVENGRIDRKQLARLSEQFGEKSARLAETERQLTRQIAAHEKSRAELESGRQALRKKSAELDRSEAKLAKSKANLAKVQLKKDVAERELGRALNEITAMKATLGWRLQVAAAKWARAISPSTLTRRRSKSRERQRIAAVIRSSDLFDAEWYLGRYPDVRQGGTDPVLHYLDHGWKEGRDPGPKFSTDRYLDENRDVAAAKINPLLHFTEYGLAEGRGTVQPGRAISRKSTEDFGPAHPCFRAHMPGRKRPRWTRAHDLPAATDRAMLRIGDTVLGFAPEQKDRGGLERAISLFTIVSGAEKSSGRADIFFLESIDDVTPGRPNGVTLVDAWFINDFTLRARWRSDFPTRQAFVLRAYQFGGEALDTPLLVGECLLQDEFDCADIALVNPFMPVLFAHSAPDGELFASSLLSFPSLCRGGLYYGELLAINEQAGNIDDPIDIIGICRTLTTDLLKLVHGGDEPLLSHIDVDLRGATGAEAVFQPEFQRWLARVARINLSAGRTDTARAGGTTDYLAATLSSATAYRTACGSRAKANVSLALPADAVPSLQALTSAASRPETGWANAGEMAGAYLLTNREPATPKKLVSMPSEAAGMASVCAQDIAATYPIFKYSAGTGPIDSRRLSAIRIDAGHALQDAELVMPLAPSAKPVNDVVDGGETLAIVWPEEWEGGTLMVALDALGAQAAAGCLSVLLLSDASPTADLAATCDKLFGSHWRARRALAESWSDVSADHILVIRKNILLHDVRTLNTLKHILADPLASTATCALVRADEGGKSRKMTCHSAGLISVAKFGTETVAPLQDFKILQRATYPIASPAAELWMAAVQSLENSDLSPSQFNYLRHPAVISREGQYDMCTSAITASLIGEPAGDVGVDNHLSPEACIHLKVLNG